MTEPISFVEQQLGLDIQVKGYRLLLKAVTLPERTKSGLFLSDQFRKTFARDAKKGLVVAMGNMAYKAQDPMKFGNEPFCKIGDWVSFSVYEAQETYYNEHLCWYIADDRVLSVIPDINEAIKELNQ